MIDRGALADRIQVLRFRCRDITEKGGDAKVFRSLRQELDILEPELAKLDRRIEELEP